MGGPNGGKLAPLGIRRGALGEKRPRLDPDFADSRVRNKFSKFEQCEFLMGGGRLKKKNVCFWVFRKGNGQGNLGRGGFDDTSRAVEAKSHYWRNSGEKALEKGRGGERNITGLGESLRPVRFIKKAEKTKGKKWKRSGTAGIHGVKNAREPLPNRASTEPTSRKIDKKERRGVLERKKRLDARGGGGRRYPDDASTEREGKKGGVFKSKKRGWRVAEEEMGLGRNQEVGGGGLEYSKDFVGSLLG